MTGILRVCQIAAALLLALSAAGAQANDPTVNALQNMPDRGSVTWRDWRLDYHIENTNMEGLTLTNVRYKDRQLLAKASLPVVRVKYRGDAQHVGSGCGPFPDRFFNFNIGGLFTPALSTGTVRPFPGKPGISNVVRFLSRDATGVETLGIFVYAEIGGYLLWHGWNFRSDASLDPVLYSSGWSCKDGLVKNDHRHHPYWRLVFDIDGTQNQIWELRSIGGKPAALRELLVESDFVRKAGEELALVASSTKSGRHALIRFRQETDAAVDPSGPPWFAFSRLDAAIRKYKQDEDRGWEFDAKSELPYLNSGESIGGRFSVLWLVTHLGHPYIPGRDDENNVGWHWTGPTIQLVDWE